METGRCSKGRFATQDPDGKRRDIWANEGECYLEIDIGPDIGGALVSCLRHYILSFPCCLLHRLHSRHPYSTLVILAFPHHPHHPSSSSSSLFLVACPHHHRSPFIIVAHPSSSSLVL